MPSDAELRDAFNTLDLDGSGKIQVKELEKVLEVLKEDTSLAAPMIKELDRDGDGSLSFDEFKAAFEKCKS